MRALAFMVKTARLRPGTQPRQDGKAFREVIPDYLPRLRSLRLGPQVVVKLGVTEEVAETVLLLAGHLFVFRGRREPSTPSVT